LHPIAIGTLKPIGRIQKYVHVQHEAIEESLLI